jgi:hypothetical protein
MTNVPLSDTNSLLIRFVKSAIVGLRLRVRGSPGSSLKISSWRLAASQKRRHLVFSTSYVHGCDPLPDWDWDWVTLGSRKGHASVAQGSICVSPFVCNKKRKKAGWGADRSGNRRHRASSETETYHQGTEELGIGKNLIADQRGSDRSKRLYWRT